MCARQCIGSERSCGHGGGVLCSSAGQWVGNTIPSTEKDSAKLVCPVYSSFSRTEPGLPTPNPFSASTGKAAPTSAHHIPWERTGAWRSWGCSRKIPCQESSLGQGRPRKTLGPGEGDQTGPQAGPLEGRGAARKLSRVRHQVKYDLQSIHRHFLYKHPSPDRKQGWGNWRKVAHRTPQR